MLTEVLLGLFKKVILIFGTLSLEDHQAICQSVYTNNYTKVNIWNMH